MKLDQTRIWSNFIWLNSIQSNHLCFALLKDRKRRHIDQFWNLATILSTAICWINSFSQIASILLFKLANFDELRPFLIWNSRSFRFLYISGGKLNWSIPGDLDFFSNFLLVLISILAWDTPCLEIWNKKDIRAIHKRRRNILGGAMY